MTEDDDGSDAFENQIQTPPSELDRHNTWHSLFKHGDQCIYFPKPSERVLPLGKKYQKVMIWKMSKGAPKVIRNAALAAGFRICKPGEKWTANWGKHWGSERYKKVQPWQKVNHYPMSFQVGRKDKMYINHMHMKAKFGGEHLNFVPETFLLPKERKRLENVFHQHQSWIIKPPALARGIGIKVIQKLSDLPRKKSLVCSRYIQDPYLINGRKFDLRIYVLVTSFDPLRIYMYKEGVVRFAANTYVTEGKGSTNRFRHLTNYSVSKKFKEKDNDDGKYSMADNKWSISLLKEYLQRQNVDFTPVWTEIESLLIKTMMSVQNTNVDGVRGLIQNKSSCYELFGFDVLLDSQLKPWLMEVNVSPSLKASCDLDFGIKTNLAVDMFNLCGFKLKDLELAYKMQTQKAAWKKPVLSSEERSKQRQVMLNQKQVLTDLTEYDLRTLKELEDEYHRRGQFERLWPSIKYGDHDRFLMSLNYADRLIHQWTLHDHQDVRRIETLRMLSVGDAVKKRPVQRRDCSNSAQTLVNEYLSHTFPQVK
ncbi:tubulin-tyrosine ligase family-domain-containing protein [Gorgonomyces haynaldii]|nr:tubulin-tyrosine ligase family-domain-containing protein [Gorgonomyces haynaldii]